MLEATILTDGRTIQAEECLGLEAALWGPEDVPDLQERRLRSEANIFGPASYWALICQCCKGPGEHSWSPSGHNVDPDGGHYGCGSCAGAGEFRIKIP